MSDPIGSVLVVGGGLVGWSAAAALRRRMPWLDVAILSHPVSPNAFADRMTCNLPSIMGFHADLGLSDTDAVARTGSAYRLGGLFAGWAPKPSDYLHAYGAHGRPLGAASFHLHWARLAALGRPAPFDAYSPAASAAREGYHPHASDDPLFGDIEAGLFLDPPRYLAMLQALARHCGVREVPGGLGAPTLRDDGFIASVARDDGTQERADLYIDATGPAALLRGAMDSRWENWSHTLRCDRIAEADGPPPNDLPLYDTVTATPAGWRWRAASPARTSHGICYASAFCDDATAARQLRVASGIKDTTPPIAFAAGTRAEPWLRNCVAIGDAATVIEPLEWCNLHLAHNAIDRIVAMMPGADFAPVELAEYNRQAHAEAVRVRDFVQLHYAVADRREPFWRDAAAMPLPPTLAHSLSLFRERGRLPFHEEETFARDSWLAVLFGQGVRPRRIDPLVEAMPMADTAHAMAVFRANIVAALPGPTPHANHAFAQTRRIGR